MTNGLVWVLGLLFLAIGAGWIRHARKQMEERRRAEEARVASFMAQAVARPPLAASQPAIPRPAPAPTPVEDASAQQKLLFEAAAKAGDAGEPALSIQLYARLIARYPASPLVGQCRSAVETQKKKLAIASAPGSAGPG